MQPRAGKNSGFYDPSTVSTDTYHVIRPDGTATQSPTEFGLKEQDLREFYRSMIIVRALDGEAVNLQRQGQLGVYTPLLGQEACQIGSVFALEPSDMIFPYGREHAVGWARGIDYAVMMHTWRGTWHGGLWDPREFNFMPYCIPVGTHIPHAVGWAYGAMVDRAPHVAVAYFGDGATSTGDFHEACNMAGVWRVPVIFFCQNNQYAISVPLAKQTAAPTLAVRALGYGFPGVRVDGNDVLACYAVMKEAVDRAREGCGPTLIEAVTYRRGPHSTADDPSRYRSRDEEVAWETRDPIARYERYCDVNDILPSGFKEQSATEARTLAAKLREDIIDSRPLDPRLLFEHVYETKTPLLTRSLHALEVPD